MIIVVTQTDSNVVLTVAVPGSGAALAQANSWLRAQRAIPAALVDAATVAVDLSRSNNFTLLLGGARTLGNPTNMLAGQAGQIVVTQAAPGGWTLAYGSNWKFRLGVATVLSTDAGAIDILSYYVIDATHIAISAGLGFL